MKIGDSVYVNCGHTQQQGGPHVVTAFSKNGRLYSDSLRVSVCISKTYKSYKDYIVAVIVGKKKDINHLNKRIARDEKSIIDLAKATFGEMSDLVLYACHENTKQLDRHEIGEVSLLELHFRTSRLLSENNITTLAAFIDLDDETILSWHGAGRRTLADVHWMQKHLNEQ